jgi:hypothetical protein
MEKMYPDCYMRIYPHVQHTVNALSDDCMYNMTHEDVDRMCDEIMNRCGVLNDPPAGHSRSTLGDFTRALTVREMSDRDRRRRIFPMEPFFFFPFGGRDFDRDFGRNRGFDRDRDRDRDFDRDREHGRDHERDRGWF